MSPENTAVKQSVPSKESLEVGRKLSGLAFYGVLLAAIGMEAAGMQGSFFMGIFPLAFIYGRYWAYSTSVDNYENIVAENAKS